MKSTCQLNDIDSVVILHSHHDLQETFFCGGIYLLANLPRQMKNLHLR